LLSYTHHAAANNSAVVCAKTESFILSDIGNHSSIVELSREFTEYIPQYHKKKLKLFQCATEDGAIAQILSSAFINWN
jgi:hypothetical protein